MARIIYGVAGEGFGHSSRSHLIGQRLLDAGHDVMFVGYKKSLAYLRQYFGERLPDSLEKSQLLLAALQLLRLEKMNCKRANPQSVDGRRLKFGL